MSQFGLPGLRSIYVICGSIWAVLWLFCFRSSHSTFPQRQATFYGAISGSPWSYDYAPNLANFILALKLSVATTGVHIANQNQVSI